MSMCSHSQAPWWSHSNTTHRCHILIVLKTLYYMCMIVLYSAPTHKSVISLLCKMQSTPFLHNRTFRDVPIKYEYTMHNMQVLSIYVCMYVYGTYWFKVSSKETCCSRCYILLFWCNHELITTSYDYNINIGLYIYILCLLPVIHTQLTVP